MSKVTVIGDGGWGTALAILADSNGIDTVLWSYSPEYAGFLSKNRENVKFLKGIRIPESIEITSCEKTAADAEYIIFVVPCEYLRSVAEKFAGMRFRRIISAIKGIENSSLERPSEILRGFFPGSEIGVLSGPSISFEVARKFPTTVVFAGEDSWSRDVQELLTSGYFRVYTSGDLTGVELGGALKNIVAIAAGISDGMGFGTNSKAAILTRGLAEITRLGVCMGARRETFSGLSGVGDLATTCISSHSRNRWFGEQIGRGSTVAEALGSTEMVVEGIATVRSVFELAKKYSVDMPITEKVFEIVHEGKDPGVALKELMNRDLKAEDYG